MGNSISDLDSLTTIGRYRIANSSSVGNTPDTIGNTALIEVGAFADYYYQIYRVYNGNTYSRAFTGTVWKSWARVDNFGCKTLAELKAALAAI